MIRHPKISAACCAVLLVAGLGAEAGAQMMERPFDFGQRDRAGLAALMQRIENQQPQGPSSVTNVESTTVVCGEGGADGSGSNAKGNSSCIVLNNATGQVGVGQDSNGNQDATATQSTTQNNMSDALEDLQ